MSLEQKDSEAEIVTITTQFVEVTRRLSLDDKPERAHLLFWQIDNVL